MRDAELQRRQITASPLEQATTYEFLVRGVYQDGVRGLDLVVTGTTMEDSKSAPTLILVPRPTCAFHFSVAVGLVHFLTCGTRRVEG